MEESELFTVDVYHVPKRRTNIEQDGNNSHDDGQDESHGAMKQVEEFTNMVSARVIKGRILELEHSNLAGPDVKFKTVVNYEKTLDPGSLLGIGFQSQDGYISKAND